MPQKSLNRSIVVYTVLTLALLGLFFVAGIKKVGAEEVALETSTKVETVVEAIISEPASQDAVEIVEPVTEVAEEETEEIEGEVVADPISEAVEVEVVEELEVVEPVVNTEVQAQALITTDSVVVLGNLAISDEQGGNSGNDPDTQTSGALAISDEQGGSTTSTSGNGEGSFNTNGSNNSNSGEGSFNTTGGNTGGPGNSGEGSFQTTGTGENSFNTLPNNDTPSGGGGGSSSGGGGSSSGGSGFGGFVAGVSTGPVPGPCPLYLREYIRLGRANNPVEVLKLQAFLNVFEGENLAITGVYTQADFAAVSRFQRKYLRDVLSPWGINESTGYVFITTRLAINNIYCNRSTANNLDLRNYYATYYSSVLSKTAPNVTFAFDPNFVAATSTSSSSLATSNKQNNFFQTAAVSLLNFIDLNPSRGLVVLLILAILFLLALFWKLSKYPDSREPSLEKLEEDTRDARVYGVHLDELGGEEVSVSDEVIVEEVDADAALPTSEEGDSAQPTLDNFK